MARSIFVCFALSAGCLFSTPLQDNRSVAHGEIGAVKLARKQTGAPTVETGEFEPPLLLPSQPCPDSWRFSGEFLYLLPTLDDTYFVLESGISASYPNGDRKNNDFGYSPAYRLGAEYALCNSNREFQAFYTYFSVRQAKTVSGSNLWATIGRPDVPTAFESYSGIAKSTLKLFYQRLDVNYSQQILNSRELYFYIQPGLEYAYLALDEKYEYETSDLAVGEVRERSNAWGVGPQLGLAFDYNFYQGNIGRSLNHAFSIASLFSGSLIVGRAKTTNDQSLDAARLIYVQDEHTVRTITALHARAGLNYTIRGRWAAGALGIGYEFNSYIRGLARSVFSDDVADAACTTNYYNFDVQGLYVSAALSF